MKRNLQIEDKILLEDELVGAKNKVHSSKTGFNTRVIITARNCESEGSKSQIVVENQTVLPGRTQLLERSFGITPNMGQHIFINDNIFGETDPTTGASVAGAQKFATTPEAVLPRSNLSLFNRRSVKYWCAGDGAMNKTVISQAYDPNATDTKLFNIIPFRFVKAENPLEESVARRYKAKVVFDENSPYYGYIGYFFKKITFPELNGINMKVDNTDYVPSWADTAVDLNAEGVAGNYINKFKGDKTQVNYIDMGMNVDANEFKEWFEFNDGTLRNATISEIGLITGLEAVVEGGKLIPIDDLDPELETYPALTAKSEVFDAELFAHLTFDPYPVSRENSTIDFDYRVNS
jgi:hypothetical protein